MTNNINGLTAQGDALPKFSQQAQQYVYVVTHGDRSKVGCSKTPSSRVASILSNAGIRSEEAKIAIIEVIDMRTVERACHCNIKHRRIVNEWFHINHDEAISVVETFKNLTSNRRNPAHEHTVLERESYLNALFADCHKPRQHRNVAELHNGFGIPEKYARLIIFALDSDPEYAPEINEKSPDVSLTRGLVTLLQRLNKSLALDKKMQRNKRAVELIDEGGRYFEAWHDENHYRKLMNDALLASRDHLGRETKAHHYSNELNMLNRLVLGLDAKHWSELHGGCREVRQHMNSHQLEQIAYLERSNATLIDAGMPFAERKAHLAVMLTAKIEQEGRA